jgi:hypothetical protein
MLAIRASAPTLEELVDHSDLILVGRAGGTMALWLYFVLSWALTAILLGLIWFGLRLVCRRRWVGALPALAGMGLLYLFGAPPFIGPGTLGTYTRVEFVQVEQVLRGAPVARVRVLSHPNPNIFPPRSDPHLARGGRYVLFLTWWGGLYHALEQRNLHPNAEQTVADVRNLIRQRALRRL